ncbi:MAG: TRAP transporter small permease [Burkholderiales bacterium]
MPAANTGMRPTQAIKQFVRNALDRLYHASGVLAAICLGLTCVVMLLQVATREAGLLFRGADDITAWLCAASAFLALGHTFRRGELVRMAIVLDRLSGPMRWRAEVFALSITSVFLAYMCWAVVRFVYESWAINEIAQGLLRVPIWIPQLTFIAGVVVFFIAVIDELIVVLRHEKPAYQLAEEDRVARGDFSESA